MSAQVRTRINLADVTSQIADTVDALEESHEDFQEAAADAAAAEADWKAARARSIVAQADTGGRTSQDVREARAMAEHEDLYRRFLLSAARLDTVKSGHRSLLARLDALRTLAADSRALL